MKGTALLYIQKKGYKVLEHVDYDTIEEMQEKLGCSHCTGHIQDKEVDFGNVDEIHWVGEQVEWEYGY